MKFVCFFFLPCAQHTYFSVHLFDVLNLLTEKEFVVIGSIVEFIYKNANMLFH